MNKIPPGLNYFTVEDIDRSCRNAVHRAFAAYAVQWDHIDPDLHLVEQVQKMVHADTSPSFELLTSFETAQPGSPEMIQKEARVLRGLTINHLRF